MNPHAAEFVAGADPKATAISLARYLLSIGSEDAERGWRMEQALNSAPDQWFAIRYSHHTAYICAGDRGRFSRTPPDNVDAAGLPVIDEVGPAPTRLRDFLDSLATTITDLDPASGPRIAALARAARCVDDLHALGSELQAIVMGVAAQAPDLPDAAFASKLEVDTRQRYFHLEIPGSLASAIYLLTRIVRVAMPVNILRQAILIRGSLNTFDGPQVFVRDMMAKILQIEDGEARIAEASAALQADAESFADLAEAARNFGEFYGTIFESAPLGWAAQQGFEFLADTGGSKDKNYKMLANVCEERVAPAYATMRIDFANAMDWRALLRHRAAIANARETGGAAAAEGLADQYTKFMLLYPPFTRDFLLGKTDTLPLQA